SRRKKLMSVPARGRQVAYGRKRGLSVRRACALFKVAPSALSSNAPGALSHQETPQWRSIAAVWARGRQLGSIAERFRISLKKANPPRSLHRRRHAAHRPELRLADEPARCVRPKTTIKRHLRI